MNHELTAKRAFQENPSHTYELPSEYALRLGEAISEKAYQAGVESERFRIAKTIRELRQLELSIKPSSPTERSIQLAIVSEYESMLQVVLKQPIEEIGS